MTKEELIYSIDTLDISTSSAKTLSHAYTLSSAELAKYRPTHELHKKIVKFKVAILKEIRKTRKTPPIEDVTIGEPNDTETINETSGCDE